jgi:hypothetical protein
MDKICAVIGSCYAIGSTSTRERLLFLYTDLPYAI